MSWDGTAWVEADVSAGVLMEEGREASAELLEARGVLSDEVLGIVIPSIEMPNDSLIENSELEDEQNILTRILKYGFHVFGILLVLSIVLAIVAGFNDFNATQFSIAALFSWIAFNSLLVTAIYFLRGWFQLWHILLFVGFLST